MRSLKLFLIALSLVISTNVLHSQTILTVQEDTIRTNTTWDADIVKVNGDITVAYNARLTITPGTYVEFQGHYGLFVYGYLTAAGTDQDSITFTINDNTGFTNYSVADGGWEGINFMETGSHADTSKLIRCRISCIKKYPNFGEYETQGGIYILSTHKVVISNCIIENNYARNSGSGILIDADLVSYAEVSKCIIRDNYSMWGSGGGISCSSQGKMIIRNNLIHDNKSYDGGGISARNNASITSNIIINNYSDGSGGGINCDGFGSVIQIMNNIICNNWAKNSGGGICVREFAADIINNTICNNELLNDWEQGGGIYINGDPNIVNNIIWGNEDNQVGFFPDDPDANNAILRHNVIQFGTQGLDINYVAVDEKNFSNNPLFVDPVTGTGIQPGAMEADWSVQPWSVCINNGTQAGIPALPEFDAYANPRIQNGQVEIGAVENHIRQIEVCGDIPTDTILTADTILVTCDVFIPDSVDVRIPAGARVIFGGHYMIDVKGRLFAEGTPTDSIHFFVADTSGFKSAVIDSGGWGGITLETDSSVFNYCTFRYSKSENGGGALEFLWDSKGSIEHCLFEYNKGYTGGALNSYGTVLTIDHCMFRYNTAWDAYGRGGGLQVNHTDLIITNTSVLHNSSAWGGAFGVVSSDAMIRNCTIAYNQPNGLLYESAVPQIVDCYVHNNSGSGICLPEGETGGVVMNNLVANNEQGILLDGFIYPRIANNTIVNNATSGIKGGNSKLILTNNILTGNGTASIDITSSIYRIYNCLIEGGIDQQYFNNGNIEEYVNVLDEDPYFTGPITGIGTGFDAMQADWSINALSPCFNAGTDKGLGSLLDYPDLAGNTRVHESVIDIGAYEHHGSIPAFTRQPKGGNICEESNFVLSVVASDTVQYQWVKDGENIPGANAARLVLDAVDFWDQGEYRCLIGNNYGQTLSNPAYVFIIELPEFLSELKDSWVAKDEPIVLNTLIKGTNPKLVWLKNGTPLSGENATQLYYEDPDSSKEGTYQCMISNLCGADTTHAVEVFLVPQLCMVTVDQATGNNLVIWEKASVAPLDAYNVYREGQKAGIYDLMGTVLHDELSIFVDATADPTVQAYLYKITGVDTSGFETDIDLCKPHKTIHLVVSTNPELNTTQLQWDRYYGFDYSTYNILRSATGTGFLPVHFLASSLASWTDPDPLPETGFYRVSVDKPAPCYPTGSGKKADSGPYSHSLSNVEDNRLKAGEVGL